MPQPSNVFDSSGGAMPYGTSPVTISGGDTYIVNSEDITPSYTSAEARTSNGGPGQKRWTRERFQYSGEWQLANTSTSYPVPGDQFTRTVKGVTAAVNFVVAPGPVQHQDNQPGSIRVITVTAEEVIYTISTVAGLA
jgi:hypothetical protein